SSPPRRRPALGHRPDAGGIVGDRRRAADIFLVGADIDADDPGRRAGEARQRLGLAAIVEAHAVDGGAVLDQPEQPWPLVAGLRARGERADLDEAEAEAEQLSPGLGILV